MTLLSEVNDAVKYRSNCHGYSNLQTLKKPGSKVEYQEDIDIPEFKEIPTYKRDVYFASSKMIMHASIWDFHLTKEEMRYSQINGTIEL